MHGSNGKTRHKTETTTYDQKRGKSPYVKLLETPDGSEAKIRGRLLHQEVKSNLAREERSRSFTTYKLIEKYLKNEESKYQKI